jgi:hypothetical protein
MSAARKLYELCKETPADTTDEQLREIISVVYHKDYVPVSKNKLYTKLTGNGNNFGVKTAFVFLELKGFVRIDENGLIHSII